jgi:peptide/nickel transport system ATP-binding protein
MREPGAPLVRIRDLKVHFPITRGVVVRRTVGQVQAVDGVSLDIENGETVGLVGESGSGKTTLGRAVVSLYRPTSGSIEFRGNDLTMLRGKDGKATRAQLQMVFQDPFASLDPRWSIEATVSEPLRIHRIGDRRSRSRRVRELLEVVGLSARTGQRYPHELSGGQRQRVGLARALALQPAIIVADEAVSALDVSIQAQIVNLLEELQREFGLTYLFIAHDLAVVNHISDRVAVMYLGRIVELAPATDVYRQPRHPYTVSLLSANPVADPAIERTRERIVLPGDPPDPASPPAGCRFHTRCWLRTELGNPEVCETEDPVLTTAAPSHEVACHFADRVPTSDATRRVVEPLAGGS